LLAAGEGGAKTAIAFGEALVLLAIDLLFEDGVT